MGGVILTHATALRHGLVVPHTGGEGALHGGGGVNDEGAGGGGAQRGKAACAAGVPARGAPLKRAERLHAATTGSSLSPEASVLGRLRDWGPRDARDQQGQAACQAGKPVSQLARSLQGR